MKGDTATDNEEATVENGGYSEPALASGERRPSLVALQNMLKKVSQSPFHKQYQTLVSPSSESESSSNNQNGVNGGLPKSNPFYSYYLERRDHTDMTSTKASDDADLTSVFAPPPEFQSFSLDQQEAHFKPDLFNSFAPKPSPDIFTMSSEGLFGDVTLDSPALFKSAQSSNLHNGFQSETQLRTEQDFFLPKTEDLVPATHSSDNLFNPQPSTAANPFYSFSKNDNNNKENKPVSAQKTDIFTTTFDDKMDIFSPLSSDTVDPFPSPITRNLDFSSMDDPFGDTPLKLPDPFKDALNSSPDIFQTFSPKFPENNDMFKVTPSSSKPPRPSPPRPSPPRPSQTQPSQTQPSQTQPSQTQPSQTQPSPPRPLPPRPSQTQPSPPRPLPPRPSQKQTSPLRPTPPRPAPPFSTPTETPPSSDNPQGIVLTTPQGSQHNILQSTPLIQANSLSVSPSQSPKLTHVPTFRRPPKPLPRIRRSRTSKSTPPEKPPSPVIPSVSEAAELNKPPEPAAPTPPSKPPAPKLSAKPSFKPLTKPVLLRKPKTPENAHVNPENFVVFEDILLIGQEQCVEDWPEDSPQNNPDFKPSGTLRLRRESIMARADFESENPDEAVTSTKKKDKKSKMSIVSRRDSKDRLSDECTGRSKTLSSSRKSSKEYFAEIQKSAEDNEDPGQYGVDYKKPHLKDKVSNLLRRSSAAAAFSEQKNGQAPQEAKDPEFKKSKKESFRRWSEGTMLDPSSGEEKESGDDSKKNRKLKLKFKPKRGFVFTEKRDEEPKGAHGYTSRKGSKDDLLGAHGSYTPRKKSQDDGLEEMKSHSLQSMNKAAFMNEEYSEKSSLSAGLNWDEEDYETEDLKTKTPKQKPVPVPRKTKTNHVTPEQMGFEPNSPQQLFNDKFDEDFSAQKGRQALSPMEMYNCEEDELNICEPKKTLKLKPFKKSKLKSKSLNLESEDPPGAASNDYMSEAAKAELMAAEKDKLAMDGFEDGDDDGDTDSLMEWWNTVEQWDEVPSDDEEIALQEDESKSFSILADKVHRGLRLFNKVFMERAEVLWQSVITLHAIADDISSFHHKAKIAGITGGTTTAVGGVTAITGLALAPFTMGVSLVVTAVGVGVAAAGGITSASAAITDNVNNMNDRKKVETVLQENEVHLVELARILHFANTGLYKLRGHPFLRSGTQHYSQDWEVRRAVQMISLTDGPVMKGTEFVDGAVSSVQGLFDGMDKYFVKDSRELKKGCKKEIVAQIKDVANVLNDCIVELNGLREELQDAIGEV